MILSFDLFDTLIKRDVHSPTDIFHLFLTSDQVKVRIKCEQVLKKIYKSTYNLDEITLETIWKHCINDSSFINKDYNFWMNLEINTELSHIYYNNVFNELIILPVKKLFVTDMYLPYETFVWIIENIIGVPMFPYNRLYVSGELGLSKQTGRIWKYIYNDLLESVNINEKILHIGDNFDIDVVIPKKHGVNTWHYNQQMHNQKTHQNILDLVTTR